MESAIEFCLVGICCALTVMLHLRVMRTSSRMIAITLLDLDVELLRTCTTAMLSMWKRRRLFDKELCQVNIFSPESTANQGAKGEHFVKIEAALKLET